MTTSRTAPSGGFAQAAGVGIARRVVRRSAMSAASSVPSRRAVAGWAIASAALSPLLLVGAWAVADNRQPPPYSPVRQTMSVLAGHAATDRWIVTGAIVVASACYLVTALGLTGVRASARLVLALAGVSGIGIAASPEPVHGSTTQHLAWTAVGAVALAVWPAFVARRRPPRPRPLVLSIHGAATVTAVFVALLGWVFIETRDGSALGLAERVTTTVQMSWPFFVALALRRSQPGAYGFGRPQPETGASPSTGRERAALN
jgi:hypothetical membrane protein